MIRNLAAYRFVRIDDPHALADAVRVQAAARDLRGTVLVAGEGINLFLAGAPAVADGFMDWLRADARFAGLQAKASDSLHVPFARLKVKVKREIIAFRRDDASPLERRAEAVPPRTLAAWLANGRDDRGRRVVLLDTRNREEVGHGTFAGAMTLPIDNFTDLPAAVEARREQLQDATVVSFCTGGIRCEKAALWMREAGMDNVLQLDGGILGWFEQVGGTGYEGRCFVFDERIALDPSLRPLVDRPAAPPDEAAAAPSRPPAVRQPFPRENRA